ncbi:MAG TPA: hypothetical protein PKK23_01160 [Nitrospirales bacterium]|nr:hypothetical protein [Nitrospirales bacterium]
MAQDPSQLSPSAKTRTVVADLLMIDGAFYVIRGDRGEVRIEVTPETQLSESFTFGDRIKAILLPNDEAIAITRAQPGETIGTTSQAPSTAPSIPTPSPSSSLPPPKKSVPSTPATAPNVRTIIADLLMVDGNFYIIRGDYGEIQIEVTPKTQLSESFKFGDRIKARITPQDQALSIVRATPGESPGVLLEKGPLLSTPTAPPVETSSESESSTSNKDSSPTESKASPKIRTVVSEILMIDGDFYILRGEQGEIRIEVTSQTVLSESFKFGDKIKARILPNNRALSIERAQSD